MELEKKPEFKANGLLDLTGMKIRSSPAYRDFIKEMGGTPVVMPITEMYTALQRGTVEGVGGDLDSSVRWGSPGSSNTASSRPSTWPASW